MLRNRPCSRYFPSWFSNPMLLCSHCHNQANLMLLILGLQLSLPARLKIHKNYAPTNRSSVAYLCLAIERCSPSDSSADLAKSWHQLRLSQNAMIENRVCQSTTLLDVDDSIQLLRENRPGLGIQHYLEQYRVPQLPLKHLREARSFDL